MVYVSISVKTQNQQLWPFYCSSWVAESRYKRSIPKHWTAKDQLLNRPQLIKIAAVSQMLKQALIQTLELKELQLASLPKSFQ